MGCCGWAGRTRPAPARSRVVEPRAATRKRGADGIAGWRGAAVQLAMGAVLAVFPDDACRGWLAAKNQWEMTQRARSKESGELTSSSG